MLTFIFIDETLHKKKIYAARWITWLIMMKKGVTSCDKSRVGACNLRSVNSRIWLHFRSVRISNAGNWNVLVPAGKEIKWDAVSKGDWKQWNTNWIRHSNVLEMWCCKSVFFPNSLIRSSLEWDTSEGDSPVRENEKECDNFLSTIYWILGRNLGANNLQY